MIGLLIAVIFFNVAAYFFSDRLTTNQKLHIWTFTIAFQQTHDLIVEFKYSAYWYFGKGVNWSGLIGHTVLLPPVNLLFLQFFPFGRGFTKQFLYLAGWTGALLMYEALTRLPAPWGYFHYGWWKWEYSAIEDPILLLLLVAFYKIILRLEKERGALKGEG
ncbi:hypothetical protein LCM10_13030 [Rossellomorea aquimaris]|uniref:hypothetical protein n=1 Tax=Rossellomorea aquimaris TaxID=189382 RepID=UPI001CD8069B|nr:hypothetical protein [Rossellomorea aquimaris]MCA1055914.1 hypothetical protein [Rossellomorea aquimaris]